MKDQYFGDINDYRKYGLLRSLTSAHQLRLGVCWLLTHSDDTSDGRFLNYLNQPNRFRHHDPELFDFLHASVIREADRRTARIAATSLLGYATFHNAILSDHRDDRADYFAQLTHHCPQSDLIFFDPDNGLDIPSISKGHRNSSKYIYRDEIAAAFATGASVLVYQHFIREKRERFTARLAKDMQLATRAPVIFTFSTPHVLFLLASQHSHIDTFRSRLGAIQTTWATHFLLVEHPHE